MSPPSLSGLTMVLNSCFLNFMHLLASYIKNLMLRLLNKMPVLKENTNTFLMLVEPFFSNSNFLLLIGHMLYFMQSFLSIESLLQFFRTNPLFKFYTINFMIFFFQSVWLFVLCIIFTSSHN